MSIKAERPIFILGNRRSGTTMLRLMLTCHHNIAIPPEGGFLVRLGWKYDKNENFSEVELHNFLRDVFQSQNIEDWELNRNKLRERILSNQKFSYADLVTAIYQEYIDQKYNGEKKRWGDKTTWYLNHFLQILGYFPSLQVIHIVRDARAVAASYKSVSHLPDNVIGSTLDWLWSLDNISQVRKKIDSKQYYMIRYEDLVSNPVKELQKICRFIQEPYDEEMLNYWLWNREQQLEPKRHLGWKSLTLENVTTERIDKWKTELTESEISMIEALAHNTLKEYNYQFIGAELSFGIKSFLRLKKRTTFGVRSLKKILREKRARFSSLIGKS